MLTMGEARSPIRPHFHNILKYPYRNVSNQLGDIVRIYAHVQHKSKNIWSIDSKLKIATILKKIA